MNEKILNNLIAERARISNRVREMIEAGVKPEDQGNYDQAMADFANFTKQIDDIKALSKVDDVIQPIDAPIDSRKGFENFVRYADASNVEMIKNSVGTGSSSAGYLVPEELKKEIIRKMYEWGAMLNIADVITTNTLTDIPLDGTAPTAYWVAEDGTFTDSSPTVSRIQLGANKAGVMIKVSEELLADSAFNVEAYLNGLAGEALGVAGEQEFVNGTVSGRPTGFLPNATLGLTSSVTNSFGYDDIIGLFTSVKTPYAKRGSFLTGTAALGTIMKLKDSVGNYVFQPAYNAGTPDLLLGRPLYTSAAMPALTTTVKGIAFGDFSYYKIGLRGGLSVQRLNELYAANGQVGFRFFNRVDGKLALAEAVKTLACL